QSEPLNLLLYDLKIRKNFQTAASVALSTPMPLSIGAALWLEYQLLATGAGRKTRVQRFGMSVPHFFYIWRTQHHERIKYF
ncbi:MAG: hypothetical protein K6G81_10210, partial [Lachnospiraceae bacterium]|nr:hypothetical protein [Lachnospiraceae bacterium]